MKFRSVGGKNLLFVIAAEPEYGPALRSRIDPLICGVGPIEAASSTGACLQSLTDRRELPAFVVSIGSAGSRSCSLGTVYQVSELSWRDIDATRLGFPPGVTPFIDRPARIALPTPMADIPTATLSTGAKVLGGDDYAGLGADMADMESFAVLRACERFGVSMLGLRGISDGPGELHGMGDWKSLLDLLDDRLAIAVDALIGHFEGGAGA